MKREAFASKSDLKGLKLTDLDRKNMEFMIKLFKTTPFVFHLKDGSSITWSGRQWINYLLKQGHGEVDQTARQVTWKKGEFDMQRSFTMPPPLLAMIKESYPSIISDTVHFNTFLKWFPEFDLRNK
jgi:hypothetical protein